MGKRTRIINDPSELVPFLRIFGSRTHKNVFDALSTKWMTEEDLEEFMGNDVSTSIRILKKGGLIESQWRMPEPGKTPAMEYRTSYSRVQTNFQCSFEDMSDIVMLAFKPYDDFQESIGQLEKLVAEGNQSMSSLVRALNLSPLYIRSLARRSNKLTVMGQRLKMIEDT
ncbi:MAG TPA: ArsR family transcriptional regulator [Methanosarcinaceae archaeon]|nr:ArsR family transcriptional regulator [Methanosarcinaceae archaeon]